MPANLYRRVSGGKRQKKCTSSALERPSSVSDGSSPSPDRYSAHGTNLDARYSLFRSPSPRSLAASEEATTTTSGATLPVPARYSAGGTNLEAYEPVRSSDELCFEAPPQRESATATWRDWLLDVVLSTFACVTGWLASCGAVVWLHRIALRWLPLERLGPPTSRAGRLLAHALHAVRHALALLCSVEGRALYRQLASAISVALCHATIDEARALGHHLIVLTTGDAPFASIDGASPAAASVALASACLDRGGGADEGDDRDIAPAAAGVGSGGTGVSVGGGAMMDGSHGGGGSVRALLVFDEEHVTSSTARGEAAPLGLLLVREGTTLGGLRTLVAKELGLQCTELMLRRAGTSRCTPVHANQEGHPAADVFRRDDDALVLRQPRRLQQEDTEGALHASYRL